MARTTKTPATIEKKPDLPVYNPRVDIHRRDDGFLLEADMPGVDADHLEVTWDQGVLTLVGTVPEDRVPEGYSASYRETAPCVYRRSFSIESEIDSEKIEARMRDGVLQITLQQSAAAHRRIPVISS